MDDGAEIPYIDLRVIEAVFHDERDPASVCERAQAFIELAAAGYRGINVYAKTSEELAASEPPRSDYRRYLMDFAHSEGWVVNARVDFKHAKLPGRIPDKFQQQSHIGGENGMGAGVLAHALGTMAWWEVPPRIARMESARSPDEPTRRTGRANAGRRAADEDMLYYGPASREVSGRGRSGAAPSPGEQSDEETTGTTTGTGYATWAANQDDEGIETEHVEEEQTDFVDEDAEAARSRQRNVTELSHAAPVTPAVSTPGGRGPTVAATRSVNAPRVAQGAGPGPGMNTALAARLRERERKIVELNARLREAQRSGTGDVGEGDADNHGQRNRTTTTTRQRVRQDNAAGRAPQREAEHTPFVAAALARETVIVRGRDGPPTDQLVIWAETLETANKFIPGLLNGLKDAVKEGIALLVYSTRVQRMTFWPSAVLIEAVLARALRLRTWAQRHMLHLVWTNDPAHSGWFIRKMQVYRNTRWEQGRAYVYASVLSQVYRVLEGLPYDPPAFSRVALPADITVGAAASITRQEFIGRHRAELGTHQLMPWHRRDGLPFASASFERGIYKSFRRASPAPLVLRTYVVAFWLYGVEFPLINGTQMPRSAPQNDEGVRWYHECVVAWARQSILTGNATDGPWWDSNVRAWAFRQGSTVVISEDGLEDISPRAPPVAPFPAREGEQDGDDEEDG
ncbi:unnamed protein product [Closterium sp. Yama58-4]|nr:unnamed protein product [Closterium sp. Yama58-4]